MTRAGHAQDPGDGTLPGLVRVADGLQRALGLAEPTEETETVPLAGAIGRVLAEPVAAAMDQPPFDMAAMDGYAVRTSELQGQAPYRSAVLGRRAAGDTDAFEPSGSGPGALRILTGAPVPPDYDAVIIQERCERRGDDIETSFRPPPGDNIRRRGEDSQAGDVLVEAGTMIDARHVAVFAAQGLTNVRVSRRVRVAFFSSGSELKMPGERLEHGQIYGSNLFMLAGAFDAPHIEALDLGLVPDSPAELRETTRQAAQAADIVVTTGGVSVGDEDHMPRIVTELGGTLEVLRIAIKPGKPVTVGRIGKTVYVGLPGNPVAAFINQILFVRPIVDRIAGMPYRRLETVPATAGFDRRRRTGREEYLAARIVGRDDRGSPVVDAFAKAGSATLVPLAQADGLLVIPPGLAEIRRGDVLRFAHLFG